MLDSKPAAAHKWTDEEMLECVSVLPESPNVVTVCFQAPSGRPFEFLAGQFLTLELPVPGGPLISSEWPPAAGQHGHGQLDESGGALRL